MNKTARIGIMIMSISLIILGVRNPFYTFEVPPFESLKKYEGEIYEYSCDSFRSCDTFSLGL